MLLYQFSLHKLMLYKYMLDLDKKKNIISLKETLLLLIMNFHISVYVIVIFYYQKKKIKFNVKRIWLHVLNLRYLYM